MRRKPVPDTMRVLVLSLAQKMPKWVEAASEDFLKRFPKDWPVTIKNIAPVKRRQGMDRPRILAEEAQKVRAAIPKQSVLICLDKLGSSLDTEQLAQKFEFWQQNHSCLCFVIGSADGLDEQLMAEAHFRWSISELTFPHALVRVILAEQIYRAWSILARHPYHLDH